jgi:HD-GYP domain-containing protein (c-di-GMP phosphodiesterase class II)
MFTPEPPLSFPPGERAVADRLMQLATETDQVEGYDQPHAIAIARLSEAIAHELELVGPDLTALLFAALAHDLGERKLKRSYLLRPGPLTWEETLDLWRHPILGEQQAAELHLPRHTQLLIRWHHEWWNGQGYPDGLSEGAIPLGARILRLADTYCSLTARRPYREEFDPLEAEQMVADQAGIELDPMLVELLLAILQRERDRAAAEALERTGLLDLPIEIAFADEPGISPPVRLSFPTHPQIEAAPSGEDSRLVAPSAEDPPSDPPHSDEQKETEGR